MPLSLLARVVSLVPRPCPQKRLAKCIQQDPCSPLRSLALWVGIWDYQWNCRKWNYLLQDSLTTDVHDSCASVYIIFMVFTGCTFHCVLIIIYLWFTIKHEYSIKLEIILLLMLSPTLLSWLHTWPLNCLEKRQVCIKKWIGRWPGNKTSLRFLLKSVAIADESSVGWAGVWSQD